MTNAAGQYELNVDNGPWKSCLKRLFLKVGAEIPYLLQPPQRVKIGADETKALNFTVAKADSSISGSVVDCKRQSCDSDLDLFIYVRNATEGAGLHDHV